MPPETPHPIAVTDSDPALLPGPGPTNAHLGKQQVTTPVAGSLPPVWESWTEFLGCRASARSSCGCQGHADSKPANRRSLHMHLYLYLLYQRSHRLRTSTVTQQTYLPPVVPTFPMDISSSLCFTSNLAHHQWPWPPAPHGKPRRHF